jgi:hypothetical protein
MQPNTVFPDLAAKQYSGFADERQGNDYSLERISRLSTLIACRPQTAIHSGYQEFAT